ncbi:hypothetical protein, partial [Thiolapillus sp.]|uniref:hypothetical protein n=1 Tax=Thiolapillus sp. TaxID=2017437 RepID=UPI003AF55960
QVIPENLFELDFLFLRQVLLALEEAPSGVLEHWFMASFLHWQEYRYRGLPAFAFALHGWQRWYFYIHYLSTTEATAQSLNL